MAVQGIVRDTVSGDPIPFAIVRVAGEHRSTLTSRAGAFRIDVPPGPVVLEIRKIGFRMVSLTVTASRDVHDVAILMRPIPVELASVTVSADYENPALRIIRQAIARKNDLLARINDYRYDAYVKFVVRDLKKTEDLPESIVLLTETQTTAYWEQPDRYQEVILARRQSRNLDAERNLVSVGQIVNFNRDRIDVGRYAVVSPTADDALDFYDYQLIDTLWSGEQMVFRLAIEPRSRARPLFAGMIDIADSTFDVQAVDVGANEALRFPLFTNLRYRQRLQPVGEDAWMPVEIRFSGELHVGVPIPGFPNHLSFAHVASLENYRFDQGGTPSSLGEYLMVVDDQADRIDSTAWEERRAVPLTDTERAAWIRIDSIESQPPPFGRRVLGATVGAIGIAANEDVFHFNRVEGAYLGVGGTLSELSPKLVLRGKTGYAFGSEEWQFHFGGWYRVSEPQRLWVGVAYRDETRSRPSVIAGGRNTTFGALVDKDDPLDYFQERGFTVSVQTKVVNFVRLQVAYHDMDHASRSVASEYSILDRDEIPRPNPPVVPGRFRSLSASLTYDSRPRLKRKGRDFVFNTFTYTQVTLGTEYASPSVLDSEFDFLRYYVRLTRRQRTLNLGLTTIDAVIGAAGGNLPPQRYFTVDFGRSEGPFLESDGFNTLNATNFSGNRVAMVHVRHDFGQQAFNWLPLLRELPLTLSISGGMFVTDFVDHAVNPGDELAQRAPTPYGELGFGIGNFLPMLSPLNPSVWFVWQVTNYDSDRFALRVELPQF